MQRTSRAEQETILRWDEEEQVVHVSSASPKTWRKCARLGLEPVKTVRARDGGESGRVYRLPLAAFRWGLKAKRPGRSGFAVRKAISDAEPPGPGA
jgi:hypothetical protein